MFRFVVILVVLALGIFGLTVAAQQYFDSHLSDCQDGVCPDGRCPCPGPDGSCHPRSSSQSQIWERSYNPGAQSPDEEKRMAVRYGAVTPHDPLEVVTGKWCCAKCGREMKGQEISTQWVNDVTPISPFCKSCAASMTADERKLAFDRWVREAAQRACPR